jgi:hypothetical protein
MADHFLLHFPDGTEYGPIDRATLDEWHDEGRIPKGALIWPDGAPEWLPVEEVLANLPPAGATGPSAPGPGSEGGPAELPGVAEAPDDPLSGLVDDDDDGPDTLPPGPAPPLPAISKGSGLSSRTRTLLLLAAGTFLVVVLLTGLVAVLRPTLARRSAIAAIERHALADRRVGDATVGFVVDLPSGWVALRDDNPYVVTRGARLRVAHPALNAFGAVRADSRPQLVGALDRYLDEVLQERRPTQPSLREGERSDVQLGRGRGRLVRTHWEDGVERLQGATVAWADGYDYYWMHAWAPADADGFEEAFVELARAVAPTGAVEARVEQAAERFAVEVPELSPQALRLLIGERLSRDESLDGVPVDALRKVSRGLDALSAQEAEEMGRIYDKIWAPVPANERRRLALILSYVKAKRPVAAADVQALRGVVKAGVVELPPEERARLQELSGRALEKALLLP